MPQKKTNKNKKNKRQAHYYVSEGMIYKDDGQEYARVTKLLGAGRVQAFCLDGVNRLCTIRGTMRNKVWVSLGDFVLVSLREYQYAKADVIHRYGLDESRQIERMFQSFSKDDNNITTTTTRECAFEFEDI